MQDLQNLKVRGSYLNNRNVFLSSGEPAIFHCHHYNTYLQAVLLDTSSYIKGVEKLLADAAQEVAFSHFTTFFKNNNAGISERKLVIEDYFRFAGFGMIQLDSLTETGGVVKSKSDHYGVGWKSRFGESKTPVSYFTTGFLTGATEALFGLTLGTLDGKQTKCIAMGHAESVFEIGLSTTKRNLLFSPGEGVYQTGELKQHHDTEVNYSAIREALTGMPIEGAADSGLISAFGVMLTRHYANYYCNISYGFLDLFKKQVGEESLDLAFDLLIEAGHVCAFNTFGGIMQSNEWNAMIKPMFKCKEDWIHGMVAAVNALGWGLWEVEKIEANQKLVLKIYSGYESNSYLKKFDKSFYPISFLATGATAGLMNLVYVLNIPENAPVTLDENLYHSIHNNKRFFKAIQTKCRAKGDAFDQFEAFSTEA